jgi:RHS repeat-associated protein
MSKASVTRFALLTVLGMALGSVTSAQVATGTPPFGSFGGGPDIINLGNLNAHITIPVINKAGHGMPFVYNLSLDTVMWEPYDIGGVLTWANPSNSGLSGSAQALAGSISFSTTETECPPSGDKGMYYNFAYTDPNGVVHPFPGSTNYETGDCGTLAPSLKAYATDGSGFYLNWSESAQIVTDSLGKTYSLSGNNETITDTNGNQISVAGGVTFYDTLSSTVAVLTKTAQIGTNSDTLYYTYTAPSGSGVYSAVISFYTGQTNFGCSGVAEFSGTLGLVSEIDLPDGTKYTFTYEPTPGNPSAVTGRLSSYTLPTGGSISYTYTGANYGINCSDGSTMGLTRTVSPGGEWIYSRTGNTTTITDATSNQTTIQFSTSTGVTPTEFYETERQIYEGPTSSTLLKTIYTCYNGAAAPCSPGTVTQPITQKTVLKEWPPISPITTVLESQVKTSYNSYGLVTGKYEYGYGVGAPGSLVRQTITQYASLGDGIIGKPSSITVEDGSSNVKAETVYCYDETTPSGTSTCSASGPARGNVTTIASLVSGTTFLGKTFTYNSGGTVATATGVNGAQTTYTYGDCANAFPTLVSEPLSLSRSMVWNCTGAVEGSLTDENNHSVSSVYNDPYFWRPKSSTDQESNTTNFTYNAQTSMESSLLFSSASTSDGLTTVDGLGRVQVSQVKESPSSSTYDSVETDYDAVGNLARKTLPYAAGAGVTNSSAPATSTRHDALRRKTQVTDSEFPQQKIALTYIQNDTYRTLSPAPSGENTKRKQFEYDALGRLTSVCEVTSMTGSGSCAQNSSATGYWTTYTYDVLNDLIGVTQNAQSSGSQQTRTYAYDALGRMTSETNPESGTTTYTYDTDTTCGITSKGDLVKKIDAVGNTKCYAYDSLHRPTSVTYSGPYSSKTPNKYFVYDAATVNGVAMTNVKSRMAEAYTATSSTGTKITDVGLSYSARGEVSDVYESTPNSGGYYHTNATYWANGALDVLTATYGTNSITGLPSFTYGPDGEGRTNTVSASTGQNPVTGTTYNVASLATKVSLGSSDSDSFTYDPDTNRMTQYEFTVDGQNVIGKLTWNPIGTLEDLVVTDPFFSGGNQSCAYSHDDLMRIASVNCGSAWSQTFTYDGFGNIQKSGTVSFQPTYSYLTNQMTQVGSSTPTYDANGNATNDTAHTYSWDAAGKAVTVDGVNLTYDALGRMVEQNKSGTYNQIVYTPTGGKLAIMNGATLQKAFVPLTGGSQAVYTSAGLAYYRHSDWIGSSRFASTPTQTMYYDGAYAPFGEAYAQTGTSDLSFTGMNQDTVANLYDFPARELNDIHGRWPSPDPAGITSVHSRDPQSWNRYAYVGNNPLSFTDPTGMNKCFSSLHPLPCEAGGGADTDSTNGLDANLAFDIGLVDPDDGQDAVLMNLPLNISPQVLAALNALSPAPDPSGPEYTFSDWLVSPIQGGGIGWSFFGGIAQVSFSMTLGVTNFSSTGDISTALPPQDAISVDAVLFPPAAGSNVLETVQGGPWHETSVGAMLYQPPGSFSVLPAPIASIGWAFPPSPVGITTPVSSGPLDTENPFLMIALQ